MSYQISDMLFGSLYMVIRTDDTGNNFLVEDHLTEIEAEETVQGFRGHKQYYTKLSYDSVTARHELFIEHGIIE